MKLTWKSELPHLVMLAAMLALAAIGGRGLPERLPVHWNLAGEPDRWGGQFEALWLVPLLTAGLYAAMALLPRIDPGRANYERFAGAWQTARLCITGFFAGLYALMHVTYRQSSLDLSSALMPLLGALLVVLGNLMGKLRPNWFLGIRTPWTLSSKRSWLLTHRAGGWVLIACGAAFVAAGFVRAPWLRAAAIGALLAGTLGLTVYSYVVWRSDPDKTPPAGTSPAPE